MAIEERLNYAEIAPDGLKAMYDLGAYIRRSGIEPTIRELVKIRTSQINGCAYCLDMHTIDAWSRIAVGFRTVPDTYRRPTPNED